MTDTLDHWPSDEAPLDVWCRPLSALCDSPRSHAWAATEFEGKGKPPPEQRLRNEASRKRRSAARPSDGTRQAGWAIKQEKRDRIARMVEQDMTVPQIAEAEADSPKNIRYMLQRMDLKAAPARPGRPPSNIDTDELVRLWHAGATYRDMAASFDSNPGQLSRTLGKMGLRRR